MSRTKRSDRAKHFLVADGISKILHHKVKSITLDRSFMPDEVLANTINFNQHVLHAISR